METNHEELRNVEETQHRSEKPSAYQADLQTPTGSPKKTLTGFARIWVIFWIVANLGATCAPANRLTDSNIGGLFVLAMLLSAVVTTGYFLLYAKKPVGLYLILIGNFIGLLLNFVEVTGYSISVTTGLISAIITYFVTRKQISYPFGKAPLED